MTVTSLVDATACSLRHRIGATRLVPDRHIGHGLPREWPSVMGQASAIAMPVLAWVQMPSAVVDMRAAFEFVTMLSQQRRGPAAHANDLRGA